MEGSFENRYNRISTELQVRIHNQAPLFEIYELIDEVNDLFKEMENRSFTVEGMNKILLQDSLIKYQKSINTILKGLPISRTISNNTIVEEKIENRWCIIL